MQVATKISFNPKYACFILVSIVLTKVFQLLHWGAVSDAKRKINLTPVTLRCAGIFTEFESEYSLVQQIRVLENKNYSCFKVIGSALLSLQSAVMPKSCQALAMAFICNSR